MRTVRGDIRCTDQLAGVRMQRPRDGDNRIVPETKSHIRGRCRRVRAWKRREMRKVHATRCRAGELAVTVDRNLIRYVEIDRASPEMRGRSDARALTTWNIRW